MFNCNKSLEKQEEKCSAISSREQVTVRRDDLRFELDQYVSVKFL